MSERPVTDGLDVAKISSFLIRWEGNECAGYIPCSKRNFTGKRPLSECGEVIASSGVTIGAGIDLGQQSIRSLQRAGVDPVLIGLFAPYLGKTKLNAVEALSRSPIELTVKERDELNAAFHGDYARRLAALYEKDAGMPLGEQPWRAQCVAVSLFYQLGNPSRWPKTWRALCLGDWRGAARELRTGFPRYTSRRNGEAEYLDDIGKEA